jgi:hypothetical protein
MRIPYSLAVVLLVVAASAVRPVHAVRKDPGQDGEDAPVEKERQKVLTANQAPLLLHSYLIDLRFAMLLAKL